MLPAVESALTQSLDRRSYEILVVGDFDDPLLAADLERREVRFIRSEATGLGGKVADAVLQAKGSVLVFLEDDDQFAPEKLWEVASRFVSDPGLVYYHNSFAAFDDEGRPIAQEFYRFGATRRIGRIHRIYLPADDKPRQLRRLAGVFPGFNNSCISIRRHLIEPWIPELRRVHLILDEFLLACALASNGALLVDERCLTWVRIHAASVSHPALEDFDLMIARLHTFALSNADSRLALVEVARRSGRAEVLRTVLAAMHTQEAIGLLRDPGGSRREMASSLLGLLGGFDTYEVRTFRGIVPLAVLFVAVPSVARRIYRELKRGGR